MAEEPVEILVQMAERGEIDPWNIDIVDVTDRFLDELERRKEIDLARQTWTVSASRIKAGREHRVPLSPRCLELLDRANAIADGGPFVFPGRPSEVP